MALHCRNYYYWLRAFHLLLEVGLTTQCHFKPSLVLSTSRDKWFLDRKWIGRLQAKSLKISHAVSNFYGTGIEIWAGFGWVCRTTFLPPSQLLLKAACNTRDQLDCKILTHWIKSIYTNHSSNLLILSGDYLAWSFKRMTPWENHCWKELF